MRAQIDRLLMGLVRVAARLWFASVEIVGRSRLPDDGPVLIVGSHFNGVLDPLLVAAASSRLPRFLAAAEFWDNPAVAALLKFAGAVPVQRPRTGRTGPNTSMFEASFGALGRGQVVALFPEGTTHDEPRLTELRTGAARIALGARKRGVRGIRIIPVGLVYQTKHRPRSRALVRIGEPIDLDRDLEGIAGVTPDEAGEDHGAAVRALTAEIRRRLALAALDYEDAEVALAAAYAARVWLRPEGARREWEPPLDEVERCARAITSAPAEQRQAVVEAMEAYANELSLLRLDDRDVVAGDLTTADVRWRLSRLVAVAAATPAAAVGVAVNGPAIAAIWGVGKMPVKRSMRGTRRILTGLALLPLSWGLLAWRLGRRRELGQPVVLALVAGPGCGLVALNLFERMRALISARASFRRLRSSAAVLPALEAARAEVVEAVERALKSA